MIAIPKKSNKPSSFNTPMHKASPTGNSDDQGGNLNSQDPWVQASIKKDSEKFREITDLKARGLI